MVRTPAFLPGNRDLNPQNQIVTIPTDLDISTIDVSADQARVVDAKMPPI